MWIRLAEQKDIDSLKKLLCYKSLLKLPEDEEIIVAEENGKILGAVTAGHKKVRYILKTNGIWFWNVKKIETDAWIRALYVREDERSRDIGKQLVKSMAAHLLEKGVKTMYAGIALNAFKEIQGRPF